MVATAGDCRWLRGQARDREARITDPLAGVGDEELDVLLLQVVHQMVPVVDLDLHDQPGNVSTQLDQRILHVQVGGHHSRTEGQLAAFRIGDVLGFGAQATGATQQLAGASQDLPPGRGQRHRAGIPIEQANPQVRLQRLDAAAERRLREIGPLRGAGEVQFLAQQDQVADALQVD
ncbi:hypothetical protein D9M71_512840 [compost metagenome]